MASGFEPPWQCNSGAKKNGFAPGMTVCSGPCARSTTQGPPSFLPETTLWKLDLEANEPFCKKTFGGQSNISRRRIVDKREADGKSS